MNQTVMDQTVIAFPLQSSPDEAPASRGTPVSERDLHVTGHPRRIAGILWRTERQWVGRAAMPHSGTTSPDGLTRYPLMDL